MTYGKSYNEWHPFPIPNETRRSNVMLSYTAKAIADFKTGQASENVVRHAFNILLEYLRNECISQTSRDYLTSFSSNFQPKADVISCAVSQLLKLKVYTLVMIMIENERDIAHIDIEIRKYSQRFLSETKKLITNSVNVSFLPEPLRSLPYCRSVISGKYIPRIIACRSGNVYDNFGVKVDNLKYNHRKQEITISLDNDSISVAVPYITLTRNEENILIQILKSHVGFSFLYGHFLDDIEISKILAEQFANAIMIDSNDDTYTLPSSISFKNTALNVEIPNDIKFIFQHKLKAHESVLLLTDKKKHSEYTTFSISTI